MAACSQYSFTCVRICLNILTILLIIKKAIPPQNFVSQIPVRMNAHFVNVRNIELYENIFYHGHQNNIFLGEAPKISALQISKFCPCSPKIFWCSASEICWGTCFTSSDIPTRLSNWHDTKDTTQHKKTQNGYIFFNFLKKNCVSFCHVVLCHF